MKTLRVSLIAALATIACVALGQGWASAYDTGLKAARALKWMDARQAFLQAAAIRPEDVSGPTVLPGPITERRQWRNGAPYSPNFLAAYSEFKYAGTVKDRDAQGPMLHTVADELQTLVDKHQAGSTTLYFLNAAYAMLGEGDKARATVARMSRQEEGWRVDTEVVDPQEIAQIDAMVKDMQQQRAEAAKPAEKPTPKKQAPPKKQEPKPSTGQVPAIKAGQQTPVGPETPTITSLSGGAAILGPVPQTPNKFALLIGNGTGKISDEQVDFASDDAQRLREALVMNGGYMESNVDLVLNATSDQILASAKALADRVSDGSTVFLFFAGVGTNIDGKDYVAGVDAENLNAASVLVAKNDIYRLFMTKGAKIFAFYQANRTMRDGRYFGMEIPLVGSIAQSQATMPGEHVTSIVRNGKTVGIYADAFASVLADLRSNKVPINEFGWQIFYRIRRGDTGTTGGGSRQTPTLPVLTNMAADARF